MQYIAKPEKNQDFSLVFLTYFLSFFSSMYLRIPFRERKMKITEKF